MRRQAIIAAALEARRFLEKVQAYEDNAPSYEFVGTKETGALRRASMDLTRSLAEMRKP